MHMRPGLEACDAMQLRDGLSLYIPASPWAAAQQRQRAQSAAATSPRRQAANKPPRAAEQEMEMRRRQRGRGGGGRRRAPSSCAALRRKVRQLRRLVPGGEDAPAESLFLRAADYITRLRAHVELLRALTALCSTTTPPAQLSADVDHDEVSMMD